MKTKKIISISLFAVLLISVFAIPLALAEPNQGNKVPITIKWIGRTIDSKTLDSWTSGGVIHRTVTYNYKSVEIYIGGSTTPSLTGTAVEYLKASWNQANELNPTGTHLNCERTIIITLPGGTFEGNSILKLDDYVPPNYEVWARGLFHGTDAFAGQTINANSGSPWADTIPGTPILWTGELLKK